MKKCFIAYTLLLLGVLSSSAVVASLSHDFSSHGYFRFGSGFSDNEGSQALFQAPGAGAKYRLGNEDNWAELMMIDKVKAGTDGPYVDVGLMAGLGGSQLNSIAYVDMAQIYIEAGDFTEDKDGTRVWVGRRYYDRRAIHINDFFYLNTLQNFDGGGVADMAVGSGKLSVAFGRQNADDDTSTGFDESTIIQSRIDVRMTDIALNDHDSLDVWLGVDNSNGDSSNNIKSLSGYGLGLIYKKNSFFDGFNHFIVQYGSGLSRHAGKGGVDSALATVTTAASVSALENASTIRIANVNHIEMLPDRSLMTSFIYEDMQSKDFDGADQTWISLGVRPIWYMSDTLRIPLEIGWDRVEDRATNSTGSVLKTTVAAEFALERGFWSRPVLRLFVTHANWSDVFKGQVGGSQNVNDTSGWSLGVQAETWW